MDLSLVEKITREQLRTDIPAFKVGDTVKVHVRIKEGAKTRIQMYEGVVVDRNNGGIGATFTVRKISSGVGVQRTFPVHSPIIDKIEVVRRGRVRRAKLTYLKGLSAKNTKSSGASRTRKRLGRTGASTERRTRKRSRTR